MRREVIQRGAPLLFASGCLVAAAASHASSHREAPFITEAPRVDNTDLYMFRSYESGRRGGDGDAGFVTIIANVQPFQAPWGGPNYYPLDEQALYEIHIDNNGDATEELTFQFRFDNQYRDLTLDGDPAEDAEVQVAIPIINDGPVTDVQDENLNRIETYTIDVVRGDRRGTSESVTNATTGEAAFTKPIDHIGEKSLPDYETYAEQHVYDVMIPGCDVEGARVFVGQRREAFYINVGETFDLINMNGAQAPATFGGLARDGAENVTGPTNVTSIALEVPTECLRTTEEPVVGAWTTVSKPQVQVLDPTPNLDEPSVEAGPFTQVSRLGNPLVNEVVIGLPDKNLFNASEPANDVDNFGAYVLTPTLPVLENVLFDTPVPPTPRNDLVQVFITGIPNLNQPQNVDPETLDGGGEILRLNTSIEPTADPAVGNLGVLACDLAGFPNGRRPVDDVVDIELTVLSGALLEGGGELMLQACDTSGDSPQVVNEGRIITDGTMGSEALFINQFPYLVPPLPGSPNEQDGQAPDGTTSS